MPVRTDPIATYRIPKRRGGTRRMAVLSERDARRWHHLAGRVAIDLEPRLPGSLLANRVPLRAALRLATTASTRLARRARVLVRTDVASFYPSVRPAVLAEAVAAAGADPEDARLAAGMLDGWGSEGYPGLPIGPPGSAVLANAVLRPVDRALYGRPFLRWVDDYLIGCPDERDAARVLEGIDEALDRLSLRRAPGKTRIEEPTPSFRWLREVSGRGPPRR